jgi:hypothetical protein
MPVVRSVTTAVVFGAAHSLESHPVCKNVHGHQYTVSFTFSGEPVLGSWGQPATWGDMQVAGALALELANRNLNEMIPAGPPSASGIAAYLLERTRIFRVTKVEVHESDTNVTGTAEHVGR